MVPLHEIHVAKGNGWRVQGWRELHAMAFDAANDPYYLILYSNSTRGYAVDLKRAQTYVADFGQKVVFNANSAVFGSNEDQVGGPPDLHVPRYTMHELTLTSLRKYDNAYTQVSVTAELTAPDGSKHLIPGFWDGDNTWKIRFAPTQTGDWQWRTVSTDDAMDRQFGTFSCVSDDETARGFLTVNKSFSYRHHFAYADGTPFLPAYLRDTVHFFPKLTETVAVPSAGVRLTAQMPTDTNNPATFTAFQQRIDADIRQGFNRFVDDFVLDKTQFAAHTQRNEGGAPFLGYDPDQLNPAYFQWMDKRLAYIIQKGGVPDIGIGDLDSEPVRSLSDSQLRTLWRYMVARYGAFNVCWNLFTSATPPAPNDPRLDLITDLAALTRKYDLAQHPLTTLMAFPAAAPGKAPGDTGVKPTPPGGKIIITPEGAVKQGTENQGAAPSSSPVQNRKLRAENQKSALSARYAGLIDAPWLDVVTVKTPDLLLLTRQQAIEKPLVVVDTAVVAPDLRTPVIAPGPGSREGVGGFPIITPLEERRRRLWRTRMLGGYWLDGSDGPNEETNRWASYCAKFFKQTRFNRLDPHPEMIGGPEESRFDRRRRLRAEAAAKAKGETIAPTPTILDLLKHPVLLLADPAWEYAAYFERGGQITLDLLEATGKVKVTWFNPRTGEFGDPRVTLSADEEKPTILGGTFQTFTAPDDNDWVLYLSRR